MPAASHPDTATEPIAAATGSPIALTDRRPVVPAERLVAEMVPPPRFSDVSFGTYLPDPGQPSQYEAVQVLEQFAGVLNGANGAAPKRGWFRRGTPAPAGPAASTSTAATASARPTCSPRSGTPSPAPRPSAPSSS